MTWTTCQYPECETDSAATFLDETFCGWHALLWGTAPAARYADLADQENVVAVRALQAAAPDADAEYVDGHWYIDGKYGYTPDQRICDDREDDTCLGWMTEVIA